MRHVQTDEAPAAVGPYSQAVIHNGIVYCSGQIGLKSNGEWSGGGVTGEARQALANLGAVLTAAGSDMSKVLKVCIYLTDMDDFQAINTMYAEAFGGHRPARATVAVAALPKDAVVEIDCIAAVD